mmetsp:Transcript_13148/g.29940  ORF Transcript_13148/g.29940 Transcript_13148/m.29940 type:complete len:716 (+) Transcript_13148:107-2254(+)
MTSPNGRTLTLRNFPKNWSSAELPAKLNNLLSKFGKLANPPEIVKDARGSAKSATAVYMDAGHAQTAVKTLHGIDMRSKEEKRQNGERPPSALEKFFAQIVNTSIVANIGPADVEDSCLVMSGFPDSWGQEQLRCVLMPYGGIASSRFSDAPGHRVAHVVLKEAGRMPHAAKDLDRAEVGDGDIIEQCELQCRYIVSSNEAREIQEAEERKKQEAEAAERKRAQIEALAAEQAQREADAKATLFQAELRQRAEESRKREEEERQMLELEARKKEEQRQRREEEKQRKEEERQRKEEKRRAWEEDRMRREEERQRKHDHDMKLLAERQEQERLRSLERQRREEERRRKEEKMQLWEQERMRREENRQHAEEKRRQTEMKRMLLEEERQRRYEEDLRVAAWKEEQRARRQEERLRKEEKMQHWEQDRMRREELRQIRDDKRRRWEEDRMRREDKRARRTDATIAAQHPQRSTLVEGVGQRAPSSEAGYTVPSELKDEVMKMFGLDDSPADDAATVEEPDTADEQETATEVVPPHFVGAVPKRKAAPPRELPEAEEAHSRGRARSPPQILAAVSKRKARPRSETRMGSPYSNGSPPRLLAAVPKKKPRIQSRSRASPSRGASPGPRRRRSRSDSKASYLHRGSRDFHIRRQQRDRDRSFERRSRSREPPIRQAYRQSRSRSRMRGNARWDSSRRRELSRSPRSRMFPAAKPKQRPRGR